MAIPVISPATLEYFSIILGEAPLMVDGGSLTATAANPTGLRLSGGNLFRDFTPWAEHEIGDWSNGYGHANIGQNGFWATHTTEAVNTLLNDLRLERESTSDGIDIDVPTFPHWTTDTWVEGKIVRANNDKLYAFHSHEIFEYDEGTDGWVAWLDARGTLHSNADADVQDYYIIDMCEFDEYLIVVTRPKFRKTEPDPAGPDTVYLGGPYLNEFFIASHGVGLNQFLAMPNVFAVRLSDKFCCVVGGAVSGVSQFTCPLPNSSTYGLPNNQWVISTFDIGPALCATAVHQYGGYLFIGGSAGFAYTSGGFYSPADWVLDGYWNSSQVPEPSFVSGAPVRLKTVYNVSTKYGGANWVTGFAGMRGQTIGDTSVYMSTSNSLFLLDLAVPVTVKVWDYSGVNVRNGKNMIAHNNDLYIPVGNGLFRFTLTGQTVPLGVDLVPETPIFGGGVVGSVGLQHVGLASSPGTLISSVSANAPDDATPIVLYSLMALKGQGWHYLDNDNYGSLYYDPVLRSLFAITNARRGDLNWDTNIHRRYFADSDADETALGAGDGLQTTGTLHLGFYSAEAPLLAKDWESVSIYGRCFSETETAEIQYQILDAPVTCAWEYDESEPGDWVSAGVIDSGTDAEFALPSINNCSTTRASKWLALRVILSGDGENTPIVEGLKIKYFVPILDYFRFSLVTTLEKYCLTDGCGVDLPEYDQALWDEEIKNAVCSTEPVRFRSIDGVWYEVRVESASRRLEKVDYSPTGRTWDVSWSLVMVQVNSATICGPDWEPPDCP